MVFNNGNDSQKFIGNLEEKNSYVFKFENKM